MLKKIAPQILVALFVVITVLGACKTSDPVETEPESTQLIGVLGDLDCTELYGDDNALANALYERCHEQPEMLAATVSAYPTLLQNCGIAQSDALEIDQILDNDSRGGEIQQQLLDALKAMLESGEVSYDYGYCDRFYTNMLYSIATTTSGQSLTAKDVNLIWVPVNMSGQAYCTITNQNGETGYFSLDMALQRFVGD